MITIDKGIPIPPVRGETRNKYPWDQMKPGDSFLCPFEEGLRQDTVRARVYQNIRKRVGGYPKEEYTYRVEPDGVRVWRVK